MTEMFRDMEYPYVVNVAVLVPREEEGNGYGMLHRMFSNNIQTLEEQAQVYFGALYPILTHMSLAFEAKVDNGTLSNEAATRMMQDICDRIWERVNDPESRKRFDQFNKPQDWGGSNDADAP